MKVRPSVKKMCDKCKVIKRKGKILVICDSVRAEFFPRVLRRGGIIYREFSRERFDIFRIPRNFLSGQSADLKFKIYFLLNMEVQLNGSYSRC